VLLGWTQTSLACPPYLRKTNFYEALHLEGTSILQQTHEERAGTLFLWEKKKATVLAPRASLRWSPSLQNPTRGSLFALCSPAEVDFPKVRILLLNL
jgi:hypothetical protein